MKVYKIESGSFLTDGGAMFGVVPKTVWQKRYPADENNLCRLEMRSLLIKTENKLILIDTGVGNKQTDYLKYYHIADLISYDDELQKLGYTSADVTDVVLTHLHFDHCGACTIYNEDKTEIIPAFPNANYWVGKAQWDNFKNPNVREGDSFFMENMLPVEEAGLLKVVEKDFYLDKNVELRLYEGHSVGQLVPYIYYGDKTIVFVGDVIPFVASIPLAWVSAYDTHPVRSMEEKYRLLKEAEEKNQILFFEHDTLHECCTITIENGKYKMLETFSLSSVLA